MKEQPRINEDFADVCVAGTAAGQTESSNTRPSAQLASTLPSPAFKRQTTWDSADVRAAIFPLLSSQTSSPCFVAAHTPAPLGHIAVTAAPSDALGAARKLLRQQRYEEAIKAYRAILQRNSRNVAALVGLGNAYYDIRKTKDALAQFQKAARVSPKSADALVGMGMCYQDLGKPAEARKVYERFLAAAPKHRMARDVRRVLERLK